MLRTMIASFLIAFAQAAPAEWTQMFIMYGGGGAQATEADAAGGFKANDPKRQHLHIYQIPGAMKPTGVYVFAHGNPGVASQGMQPSSTASAGYSVISWESVTPIQDPADVETCQSDLSLVMAWIKTNAKAYNFDANNIIISGRSRGSICSWMTAHGGDPGVKGLFM